MRKDTLALGKRSLQKSSSCIGRWIKRVWQVRGLYLLLLPALAWLLIFKYGSMYGIQIAFRDYSFYKGISGSPYVGFKYFEAFWNQNNFWRLFTNTLILSFYQLLAGFPLPIIFALLLNHFRFTKFKKLVQTISYAPYFISTVVMVAMLQVILQRSTGIVNLVLNKLGIESIWFLGREDLFRHVYVWSGVWQSIGWSSIIYIAALAGVSPDLHEAAIMDGANKIQRMIHVDFPTIVPTIVTMLILNTGHVMSLGFEKAYLMQNSLNSGVSEIIATYVYKIGLTGGQFSFSTAISVFNSVINLILLITVNYISNKLTDSGLF